jgi:hypothetical protein
VANTTHLVRGSGRMSVLISGCFSRIAVLREACGSSCRMRRVRRHQARGHAYLRGVDHHRKALGSAPRPAPATNPPCACV